MNLKELEEYEARRKKLEMTARAFANLIGYNRNWVLIATREKRVNMGGTFWERYKYAINELEKIKKECASK